MLVIKRRNRLAPLAIAALILASQSAFGAANVSALDPRSEQAANLFKEGKLKEAAELEETVVHEKPEDWLPHAALSYLRWRQGEVMDALSEGKDAARLAPNNLLVLTNLGRIALNLGDYQDATPAFENAKKAAPRDWSAWLGLAQCYVMSDHIDKAVALLQQMSSQDTKGFDWSYQTGEFYLKIDQPKLAAETAAKAMTLATTSEQKAAAQAQLFLALLQDNQVERARSIQIEVLKSGHSANSELYVRAASELLPATEPNLGEQLLQSALHNLTAEKDATAFFRLGRLFQNKAESVSSDGTKNGAWLSSAGAAFRQASALDPEEADYHLAFAGTLYGKGQVKQLIEELTKAQSLDKRDTFAPYLVSRINVTGAEKNPLQPLGQLKLTRVLFKINELSCGCKISRMLMTLKAVPGVALVVIPNRQPYEGTILIDESVTPINDVLSAQRLAAAFPPIPNVTKAITLERLSSEPIASATEAIEIALKANHPDLLRFNQQFEDVQPIMPVVSTVASNGS